jgi:hypothetical protein
MHPARRLAQRRQKRRRFDPDRNPQRIDARPGPGTGTARRSQKRGAVRRLDLTWR